MYAVVLLVCCSWVALLCPSVQAYENLALNKPAWQSSTQGVKTGEKRVYYIGELAVDGRYTDLDEYGGECAASDGYRTTAEWRVDLGGVKYIHHVFIQYVTNNKVWDEKNTFTRYFLGFSVYISNTTNKEDGVLCFRDTNYTRATIPNPVNITCPYHGRYVIYYNNRTHPPYPEGYTIYAYIRLCEVEVYGCPTPGRYGKNCSLLCPENCICDVKDNTCVECVSGYKGHLCFKECDGHTYGLKCNQSCGKCSGGVQCDHVTGSCPNGCDAGMNGDRCDLACQSGRYGISCAKACGVNCQGCNRFNGVCEFGCHPGWTGTFCEKRRSSFDCGHYVSKFEFI
ncbi:uncharacterized protein LOC111113226 isoform X2 [Crassostrea virginica]